MKRQISRFLLVVGLTLALAAAPGAGLASSVLSGVPEYLWYHGCSPTSGGMLMGYWAGKGYTKLLPGVTNPMVQSTAVNQAISSTAHNVNDTYVGHTANCVADFMQTVRGGTYGDNIPTGLANWTSYVGLTAKTASLSEVSYYGGSFDYMDFVSEINAGRPMLLNLATYAPSKGWEGHTVLAYGYQADMFALRIYNGTDYDNITVPGFAVMDTWKNGVGPGKQSDWEDWSSHTLYSQLVNGVEWWPFLDMTLTNGYSYTDVWDWQIDSGVFYEPVPVPPTLVLLGSGLLILLRPRRRQSS
jgi:hypothetical protein